MSNFNNFLEKFRKKENGNLIVVLDQIVDPQNFGSVIRTAFFLGADFIMLNKLNKPPISSTVSKVSSGASECVDLFSIKNLKNFLTGINTNKIF
jgi:21S rRNA (GM2251-2'-O)-methyltransferase